MRIRGAAPAEDARAPLNLALVLDRSGSMAGEKLAAAKAAATQLARRVRERDVISVVIYDDSVDTVVDAAPVTDRDALLAGIAAIEAGGSTNLSGGWLRGRDLVARGYRQGAVNRVLLLTDGLANHGITDPDQLKALCGTAAAVGVTTTTIGFGEGFDEVLLRGMADVGRGGTYYVEESDQALDVFAAEIDGLLTLAAQNVAVQVLPAPGADLAVVHHAYPRRQIAGGVRLEIGDLFAGEPRALLAQFLLPLPATDATTAVAELVVEAHVLGAGGSVERREVRLPITVTGTDAPRVEPEVRRELLLLESARARDEARELERQGEFDAAGERLGDVARKLTAEAGDDARLREEAADLGALAQCYAAGDVREADRKYMYMRSTATWQSRHGAADPISRSKLRRRPTS
ncbi:MAG: vWA domain-containing protein [Longimicrobiales bacterium]